jgi:hypothetical protein
MRVNIKILIPLLFFACSFYGNAQNTCVQNLRDARNAYDEGKLQSLPELLLKCIENGFSKEEKVEALRLVTLSHLFNEDQQKAETSYLRLLKIDPEFKANEESDPTELLILAENFDTDPKFFFGFKGGASYNIMDSKPEFSHNLQEPGSYDFPLGISGGLFFQYPINDKFSANLEAIYSYRNSLLNRPLGGAESSAFFTVEETQQGLEVPILVNYKLPWINRFLLEATGGPSFHYLLISDLNTRGSGTELNNLDMLPYRNQFNMSGIIGLRANFKELGANYITLEMLFQYKVLSEVNQDAMPEEVRIQLATSSTYTDFNYKGHALWLRLGLRFPYFKPELIK